MTAQERPSLGQPPHLTLPHTQCSHRNTYKDLERRPARGPRGKKSLGRRGGGRRGLVQIPNCCKTKPASRMRDRRNGGRGTVPARTPSCPSRVAYNKVQICPADQFIPPHLSPRANSVQATKRCLARHTLQEDWAKEFKGRAINLQAADSHAQPPLPCVQNTTNTQQTNQIPQRQRLGDTSPLALRRYFLSDPFFSLHLLTQGL